MNINSLSGQIVQALKDYDIYEYHNNYITDEQAIKETAKLLKSDPGVVQFALTEMCSECETELKTILERLKNIVSEL